MTRTLSVNDRLVVLEEVDDLVVAHFLSRVFSLPVSGLAAGLSLYPSLSLLEAPCWCDTHLGLSIASNEPERPGFRDEIIIRRHRVHDPREEANPLRAR